MKGGRGNHIEIKNIILPHKSYNHMNIYM